MAVITYQLERNLDFLACCGAFLGDHVEPLAQLRVFDSGCDIAY